MNSLVSLLKPLILFEIIILLLIFLVVAVAFIIKQRLLVKRLHNKLLELSNGAANIFAAQALDDYFSRSLQESLARYEKLAHSPTIIFDISRPYSEKVAALRYIYLNLEKEAEEIKRTRKIGWNFYEDRLELLLGLIKQHGDPAFSNNLQQELQAYKTESQLTIAKLKEIIGNLQQSLQHSVRNVSQDVYKDTVESIISNDNLNKIRELFEEMKLFSEKTGPHTNNQIERSINTLEYEVETSDRYISSIINGSDQQKVNLDEVNKLKESNRVQRSIISTLEKEIHGLKDSIDVNSTQEVKDTKEAEISRLERVVKEYEGCVIILEGQIDDLYSRLEEKSHSIAETPVETSTDLKTLNAELENVSKRMNTLANDYRQAVAVNRAIYHFCHCKTVKEIANEVVKILKEFGISAGFYIQSNVGKADYFPSLLFNDALKKQVKNASQKDHIGQLNGHSLFVAPRMKMLVLTPEDTADTINSTISGLVSIASENVQRLESLYHQKKNAADMEGWIGVAKNKIANIDIQFSYQSEESHKIFTEFLTNLKAAYTQLELKGDGAILLDNAINQYEARMQLLLSGSDVIDRELGKLLNHLGTLKLQNALHQPQ